MQTDIHTLLAKKKPRRWPFALAACGVVLLGAAVAAYRYVDGSQTAWDTESAVEGDLVLTVSATGTLESTDTVEVGAEVSGRVYEVLVDDNDPVTVGQILARIDTEQLSAAVDEAKAKTLGAEASLAEAKASYAEALAARDRAESEWGRGLISRSELESKRAAADRAIASVHSAESNSTVARASLASAESKLDKAIITSPIDGFVLSREVSEGQTVTAGYTTPVLFELATDLSRMRLVVDIDEADIGAVKSGEAASFTVDAFGERRFPSEVGRVSFAPTETSNVVTYEARLDVDNADLALRPGMTATADIVVDEAHGILVPATALRFDPEGVVVPEWPHVWVLTDGQPSAVAVQIGESDGTRTVVDGVAPGAVLVVGTREES